MGKIDGGPEMFFRTQSSAGSVKTGHFAEATMEIENKASHETSDE
jgi:hypothetical protein